MLTWEGTAEGLGQLRADLVETARRLVCQLFHSEITRPVRGEYRCLECGRVWPSAWR